MTKTMDQKLFSKFFLGIFLTILLVGFVNAVTLAEWPLTTNGSAINVAANVSAGIFVNSTGINQIVFTSNGASSSGWSTGDLNTAEYFEVTISPQTGNNLLISQISFNYSRSNDGPLNYTFQWDDNAAFSSPITISTGNPSNVTDQTDTSSVNISASSGETIYLRWFAYNASSAAGTFRIKSLNIQGTVTPVTTTQTTIPPEITACNATGNPGDLRIRNIDFTNNGLQYTTFGEDDKWFPFENIEVEIEVKNNGNEDINDIELNWGLWSTKNNEWVIEPDDLKDFDLKDGDTKTLSVSFKIDEKMDLDLEDLTDGDNYRFYVFGKGETEDTLKQTCASSFEQVSIVIESDFVVLNNFEIPEVVQCGATVEVRADVLNVGDRDQDEVSVYVFGREIALNLSRIVEVGDIDAFDKKPFSFTFVVPNDLEEKNYALKFEVIDEDGNVYESDFDDDLSEFTVPLKVEGSCSAQQLIQVSASLESKAVAGKELIVKLTFTNSGKNLEILTLNTTGFESFANSASLDQKSVVIGSGQSKDVLLTLDVKKESFGEYTFYVEALSSDGRVIRQPVSVTISPTEARGITGAAIFGENWLTWAIGILNVILVIIIIIVAIRLAKK